MLNYLLLVLPALCAYVVSGTGRTNSSFEGDAWLSDDLDLRIKKRDLDDIRYPFLVTVGWVLYENWDTGRPPFQSVCGGAIITASHVLTATHCVYEQTPDREVGVLVRRHFDTAAFGVGDIETVKGVQIHQDYKTQTDQDSEGKEQAPVRNDIALLTLENPLVFSNQISPICLHFSDFDLTGTRATALLGIGTDDLPVHILRERIAPMEECVKGFSSLTQIRPPNKLLCAPSRSVKICPGEFAGPLLWFDGKTTRPTLLGIHSYGSSCTHTEKPKMYTQVKPYRSWIESRVKIESGELCYTGLHHCIPKDDKVKERESKNVYPYLATVGWNHFKEPTTDRPVFEASCGGAIITKFHVITAAHCVSEPPGDSADGISVLVGTHSKGSYTDKDLLDIREVQVHPNFRSENDGGTRLPVQNDIAVLVLDLPLVWSDHVGPICILPPNYDLAGTPVTVFMGAGIENSPVVVSDTNLYSGSCLESWDHLKTLNPHDILCVGPHDDEDSICPGESGGPLVWYNHLVGIHSFGDSCKNRNKPTIFTKLSTHNDWIQKVVRRAVDSKDFSTQVSPCFGTPQLCPNELASYVSQR